MDKTPGQLYKEQLQGENAIGNPVDESGQRNKRRTILLVFGIAVLLLIAFGIVIFAVDILRSTY